jgi:hypothetical protein
MDCDILIVGAGISGLMMAKRLSFEFPQKNVLIVDRMLSPSDKILIDSIDHPFHLHRIIKEIPLLANLSPENMRVNVFDGISFKEQPSLKDINKYSKKIFSCIQVSNITNVCNQTIYPIAMNKLYESLAFPKSYEFISGIIDRISPLSSLAFIKSKTEFTLATIINYKYLINTIPLNIFLEICGERSSLSFVNHPIVISSVVMENDTNLYQMCYCCDPDMSISRTTLLNKILFIERVSEAYEQDYTEKDKKFLLETYGIKYESCLWKGKQIQPGRIIPLPREQRKPLFYYFTEKHNIFFLGRYGAWAYKVANDVWDDTKFICKLINAKEQSKKYNSI